MPLHDLLRELFVKPMKLLENGIRVSVTREGRTEQWLLVGTLHGLPSDHIGQVEMVGFTGPTSLLPSKYNLLLGRPRKKKKNVNKLEGSEEGEESNPPQVTTPKIIEVSNTFDERYQRTGRNMLAIQGEIASMNMVGNPSRSKIEEKLRSQGMTSLVSKELFLGQDGK